MKVFLVGGAVRDELLGRTVSDRDYVVTGASIEQMKAAGYQQVGADFPVFLHPATKQEYALARTERKSGVGHKGFQVDFNPSVTLEEDLSRRDLTINAIAKSESGELIDPFHGREDIQRRLLRHVSQAFVEDPLRVLRVARFAAQLKGFNFQIHQHTLDLMRQLAQSGELSQLTAERVFKETHKALVSDHPEAFFEILQQCGALAALLPQLTGLANKTVSNSSIAKELSSSGEVSRFQRAMSNLRHAVALSEQPEVRWAAFLIELAETDNRAAGLERIIAINQQLKVPASYALLAEKAFELEPYMAQIKVADAPVVLALLQRLDAFRRPHLLAQFMCVCKAKATSSHQSSLEPDTATAFLQQAFVVCSGVTAKPFIEQGAKGVQIKTLIENARIERLKPLIKQYFS